MGMLNRIVNIAVLVLALLSVIFGALLFLKREELRARGDKLSGFVVSIAKTLDTNSATDVSKNITADKLILDVKKDPKAADNAKKSLYHDNYANLENVLSPVKAQSEKIVKQRDDLGTALSEVGKNLELPEQFAPIAFQGVPSYVEKKTQLLSLVQKVNDRDNAIINQIGVSAGVIGTSIDKDGLKNLESYSKPLADFATGVDKLKKRSDGYAQHINKICGIFEVSQPSLSGEDYPAELAKTETGLKKVKEDYEVVKAELKQTKEKLAKTEEDLKQAEAKIDTLEKENNAFKTQIADIKKQLKKLLNPDGDDEEMPAIAMDDTLVKKLEGKVIEVNDKWDFVVIDLGKKSKLAMGDGKKKREIPVALPEGKIMMISRGDDYVAKIKVVRVNDNCAIGDILPDLRNGKVSVGDKVFFAPDLPAADVPPQKAAKADKAAPAEAAPAAAVEAPAAPAAEAATPAAE